MDLDLIDEYFKICAMIFYGFFNILPIKHFRAKYFVPVFLCLYSNFVYRAL